MTGADIKSFKKNYPSWILFNFVVLAIAGALLRYMHCFSLAGVNYQFLLHAHSHFAFAGWMFLAIALLLSHFFIKDNAALQQHFQYLFLATIPISFGMLVSFFLTGYQSVSIILSTLFIVISFWFVFVMFKSKVFQKSNNPVANVLIKGGLILLLLSSIGPFSLGYLKANGTGSFTLQQNAIYFYLHFQLNGFMQLALLGLFIKTYLKDSGSIAKSNVVWANILVLSTLPLYAMFTLWSKPPIWVYVIAFLSAVLHFVAWAMLFFNLKGNLKPLTFLARVAFFAVSFQFLFQILIGFPTVGNWVFGSRNVIIGYIHLLTLGSLSPLIIDLFIKAGYLKLSPKLNFIFVADTVLYLTLLFGSAALTLFGVYVRNVEYLLFITNLLLPFIGLAYFINAHQAKKQAMFLNYPINTYHHNKKKSYDDN